MLFKLIFSLMGKKKDIYLPDNSDASRITISVTLYSTSWMVLHVVRFPSRSTTSTGYLPARKPLSGSDDLATLPKATPTWRELDLNSKIIVNDHIDKMTFLHVQAAI